jgi:3-oxoacyl-[acyl-carrier-protein] synthase II
MPDRVVITGMGWVTPLGLDIESVWSALLAGRSAVAPVSRFDARTFLTNFAAEVKGYDASAFVPDLSRHEGVGLNTLFALGAAAQAWEQARLRDAPAPDMRRFGMYLGSGEGTMDFDNFVATNLAGWDADARAVDGAAWARAAYERLSAVREIEQEPNATLAHLAMELGPRGPAVNCMTACAASTQAVGEAFETIRRGDADAMLAGGAHTMIHPLGMTGFIRLTAMSKRRDDPPTAGRPFDQTRDGFVMGEGAGMLVLESLRHTTARGAKPLAEVVGYGSSADAFRITDMHPEGRGPAQAMGRALAQAGIDPREPGPGGGPPVDYISAHGTGTKENDSIETAAIKAVFGTRAPPVSSIKGMMGHLIQAAGAVELITCVQAIRTGWLPPSINLHHPDPALDLDYVPNRARDTGGRVEVCLSNSFGFGGQNDTVCVRRFRG